MALGIDEAGVTRVEPPFAIDHLTGRFLVLQVAGEDARAPHEYFTAVGDLDLDALAWAAHGRGIRLVAGLQRDEPGRLRRAIHLLEVDADRAEEAERVGAERRAAGEREARAAKSELVAHGSVDEELAERVLEPESQRHRLPVGAQDLRLLGDLAEHLEDAALQGPRIPGAHEHAREHVLPDARGRQHLRRPELTQVALHGLRALGTVAGEPHVQAHDEGVEGIAHPRHGQIGEVVVVDAERLGRHGHARRLDGVLVADHRPLGMAGRARRVADERDVVGLALLDLPLEEARVFARPLASERLDVRE